MFDKLPINEKSAEVRLGDLERFIVLNVRSFFSLTSEKVCKRNESKKVRNICTTVKSKRLNFFSTLNLNSSLLNNFTNYFAVIEFLCNCMESFFNQFKQAATSNIFSKNGVQNDRTTNKLSGSTSNLNSFHNTTLQNRAKPNNSLNLNLDSVNEVKPTQASFFQEATQSKITESSAISSDKRQTMLSTVCHSSQLPFDLLEKGQSVSHEKKSTDPIQPLQQQPKLHLSSENSPENQSKYNHPEKPLKIHHQQHFQPRQPQQLDYPVNEFNSPKQHLEKSPTKHFIHLPTTETSIQNRESDKSNEINFSPNLRVSKTLSASPASRSSKSNSKTNEQVSTSDYRSRFEEFKYLKRVREEYAPIHEEPRQFEGRRNDPAKSFGTNFSREDRNDIKRNLHDEKRRVARTEHIRENPNIEMVRIEDRYSEDLRSFERGRGNEFSNRHSDLRFERDYVSRLDMVRQEVHRKDWADPSIRSRSIDRLDYDWGRRSLDYDRSSSLRPERLSASEGYERFGYYEDRRLLDWRPDRYDERYDDRYDDRFDERYDDRYEDRHDDNWEVERNYSRAIMSHSRLENEESKIRYAFDRINSLSRRYQGFPPTPVDSPYQRELTYSRSKSKEPLELKVRAKETLEVKVRPKDPLDAKVRAASRINDYIKPYDNPLRDKKRVKLNNDKQDRSISLSKFNSIPRIPYQNAIRVNGTLTYYSDSFLEDPWKQFGTLPGEYKWMEIISKTKKRKKLGENKLNDKSSSISTVLNTEVINNLVVDDEKVNSSTVEGSKVHTTENVMQKLIATGEFKTFDTTKSNSILKTSSTEYRDSVEKSVPLVITENSSSVTLPQNENFVDTQHCKVNNKKPNLVNNNGVDKNNLRIEDSENHGQRNQISDTDDNFTSDRNKDKNSKNFSYYEKINNYRSNVKLNEGLGCSI
ncbi:hypothetical protein HK099_006141 [Clydaea vesicula]|uniref:Uncharacterized protein n=1 Tax=Clydaea vesicula TaxID=447962 RepID=A0AAD5XX56_9FUNG|nr:hypothetical protein HK099_006141 [Clydaea vesicula]